MRIGGIDTGNRVLLIAEIGNNHEGRPDVARELVERAAEAGAGAVKLQVFEAERFVRPRDAARLRQLSGYQLPRDEIAGLCERARGLGLAVIATPLDTASLDFIAPLVDALKIASGDNDCYPLIERVAGAGLPMVISSGLLEIDGIRSAIGVAERRWERSGVQPGIAVLHCVSAYPVSAEGADLGRIAELGSTLDCTVGYSDHALGIDACVEAAGLGARLVEKHFTLDHDFSEFRDHQLSADPSELAELAARLADPAPVQAPGADQRRAQERARRSLEEPNRVALRRSIVAGADLDGGHELRLEDLTWMRPRDGLPPGEEDHLVGRRLRRPVGLGESILPEDLEEASA